MPKDLKPILALITVSAIWGGASVIIKYTLQFISPFSFLYIRFVLASIILYFLVDWDKHEYLMRVNKKGLFKIFLLGSLGSAVNLGLYFFGIKYTTAIEATIIYSFTPIFVLFGSVFLLKEKITKRIWLGYGITILGFLVVILQPILDRNVEGSETRLYGNFLIFLSVLAWAMFTLISKNVFNHDKTGKRSSPLFITFVTFFSGALVLMPFGLYEIWNSDIDYVHALPGILYMTIFSTVIAYSFFEYGVKKIKVSQASIFQYIQPVFTIPIAMIALNEKFSIYYIAGGALLLLGLYFSESNGSKKSNF